MLKRTIFILLFLLLTNPCYGAESIAGKIQNFYDSLEGFSANFTQTLEHRESGAREKRSGTLNFKKPFLVSWKSTRPNEESIIVNEREIWNYLPDEEIAYKYSPAMLDNSSNIVKVLTGQVALNKEFDIKDNGRDNGLVKLLLYPHEPTPQLVEALIWVNEKTGQISRAKITDFYGNANDVSLEGFKKSQNLKNDLFRFNPPKGIEVEDRTNEANPGKELFK